MLAGVWFVNVQVIAAVSGKRPAQGDGWRKVAIALIGAPEISISAQHHPRKSVERRPLLLLGGVRAQLSLASQDCATLVTHRWTTA
jgi:hypothetical protein